MRADFLTITYFDEDAHASASGIARGVPRERFWFGARGIFYEESQLYLGRFSDGRFIASVAGPEADSLCDQLLPALKGDFSAARLDVQSTIPIPNANEVIENLHPHPRYRAILLRALDPHSGSTLYVGAPASRKRMRVYNKTRQSGQEEPLGELLRVELVLRDANADLFTWRWKHAGKGSVASLFRATATAMCRDLDDVLPANLEAAHIDVPERGRPTAYVWWLEHSVIPGVVRAMASENDEVRELLARLRDTLDGKV